MATGIQGMPDMPTKEREVKIEDRILHWAFGHLRWGDVTKVTAKYVWIEYTIPSSGQVHNTKRIRDIALMYSKFY